MAFYRQYGFWRGMVAGPMETTLYVVPVPGNHEVQCKACGKMAKPENEDAWRANMGDLILDDSRFQKLFGVQPTNREHGRQQRARRPIEPQSQLSYSFDLAGSHFVVINTDPVGNDAHAPVQFLASRPGRGCQSRDEEHSSSSGTSPHSPTTTGRTRRCRLPVRLDNDTVARDQFWTVIQQYGAVYFCGTSTSSTSRSRMGRAVTQRGRCWWVPAARRSKRSRPIDHQPADRSRLRVGHGERPAERTGHDDGLRLRRPVRHDEVAWLLHAEAIAKAQKQ